MFSFLHSDPLPAGTAAPEFSAPDESGRTVTLAGLRGRHVVLVFYPGDDTPVCTRQLCEFRDRWELLRERGVEVLGINPWSAEQHTRFRRKFAFPFPLIVDRGRCIARLYHADALVMVRRTVYLVGPDGMILYSRRGKPSPEEILQSLTV